MPIPEGGGGNLFAKLSCVDVGISGGVPGRSRRDPQKVWFLGGVSRFLSHNVDSIPRIMSRTLVLQSLCMHTNLLKRDAYTVVYTAG